jgi:hypothetical protein
MGVFAPTTLHSLGGRTGPGFHVIIPTSTRIWSGG